jgi:GntR family transcriptional regulator, rspAB operon transcriptional repressor
MLRAGSDFVTDARSIAEVHEREEDPLPVDVALDRKLPVSDQVYLALRRAILSVDLKPGASISENRICRHFGVSRTPVRTAIVRLAEEGLIDVYPQQGSFVSLIRLAEVGDSHFVRTALEVAILREVAQRWLPEYSVAAREVLERQRAALAVGDHEEFLREDDAFHGLFAEIAGRPGVWVTILAAKARLGRFIRLSALPGRLPNVVAEHAAIVDALDRGREEDAVKRLLHHLDQKFVLMKQLPDHYLPYVVD